MNTKKIGGAFSVKKSFMYKLTALVMCVLLMAGMFSGCSKAVTGLTSGTTTSGEYPVTIGETEIKSRPQKVVVISPSLADVVVAIGSEAQLVAGVPECTQYELESLTKIEKNDTAKMTELAADLILAEPLESADKSTLSALGVTVLEIEPAKNREDFERLYGEVSSVFNGGGVGYEDGVKTARKIFTTLDDIQRLAQKDTVTTGCYLYDLDNSAVTGDMFGSTVMEYAGITNIFNSLRGGEYEFDVLKLANPYVIFCGPGLRDEILTTSKYSGLLAVMTGKVYEMPESYMQWQGRTVITSATTMSGEAFPELLKETSAIVTDPTEQIEDEVESKLESETSEEEKEYETLEQGASGDDVLAMQKKLSELGYLTVEYDGHYGEVTATAVKDFQKKNELEETGKADSKTLNKLYSSKAKAKDAE